MTIGRKMDAAWKKAISDGKRKLNGGPANYKAAAGVGAGIGTAMGVVNGVQNFNNADIMSRTFRALGAPSVPSKQIAKAALKATATKLIPIHAAAGVAGALTGRAIGHSIEKKRSIVGRTKSKLGIK